MVPLLRPVVLVALLAIAACAESPDAAPGVAVLTAAPLQPPVMPTRRPTWKPATPREDVGAVPPPALLGQPATYVPEARPLAPGDLAATPPPPTVTPASTPAISPGATAPGLRLSLRLPKKLPHSDGPLILPVEAKLSNIGTREARLNAPTPCDVAVWQLQDARGEVLLAKDADICAQVVAESSLKPGETLITRDQIAIPGHLLGIGSYRLRYAFWGTVAEETVTVE
ncbi:hypothetical protein [Zavarzinia aquatilis]|uniref:Intracellular proteinase inhibitor BsuPI domain-containing protein n=1 Tax=Zavarzinia aquatilis TaxID=2211142 RepID=A0A317ED40_9PROT|nr:hypothetical protein [Zavarzinia aquatilis]PWR24839.1 hypothetical protein DKG74_03425 [Zavarzinia aquatilis]